MKNYTCKSYDSVSKWIDDQNLRNKTVAILIPGYYAAKGGMYEYALSSAIELNRKGYDAYLILNSNFDVENIKFKNYKLVSDELGVTRGPIRLMLASMVFKAISPFTLAGYRKSLLDLDPAVVWHTDNYFHSSDMVDFYNRTCQSVKILYTVHDPIYHDEALSFTARWLRNRTDRKLIKSATTNRVTIHTHKCTLLENSIFRNCPNIIGAPHAPIATTAHRRRKHYNSVDDSFRIGFLGRIEKYKGIDLFIDACEKVLKYFEYSRRIEIVIMGPGTLNKDIPVKMLMHTLIANEYVTDEEFHNCMADLDLLVLPYTEATWSGVGSMANSYNIPMVATDVGAISEIVTNEANGYLVSESSSEVISEKIIKIILNPELHSKFRKA